MRWGLVKRETICENLRKKSAQSAGTALLLL
jgi:hypothetical protein